MLETVWIFTRFFKSLSEEPNLNSFFINLLGDNINDCFINANNYCFFADYYFFKLM